MKQNYKNIFRFPVYCLLLTASCLLFSACGGSLYKVKPVASAPLPDDAKTGSSSLITLRAVPIFEDEESQDLFETNLPLAGVLPVRVEIENKSGAVIELKKARFSLLDASGKEWKNLSVKDTVNRVLKANRVRIYTPASKQAFTDGLNSHALNVNSVLNQGEKRVGILFFQSPNKVQIERQQGLILRVEKLPERVELRLN